MVQVWRQPWIPLPTFRNSRLTQLPGFLPTASKGRARLEDRNKGSDFKDNPERSLFTRAQHAGPKL